MNLLLFFFFFKCSAYLFFTVYIISLCLFLIECRHKFVFKTETSVFAVLFILFFLAI